MSHLFLKTPSDIMAQIQFWYLKYHGLEYEEVDGIGVFTLFDKMPSHKKEYLLSKIKLSDDELPVLVLANSEYEHIINTTHRFIRLENEHCESLFYTQFYCHKGFKSIGFKHPVEGLMIPVKSGGYFAEFGLKTKEQKIIYWNVPTGEPGFAFWYVTKKCELIGRKYLVGEGG